MSVAGTAAITEMWAKCKAWFGRKLGASTTATTISIHLKNNAGDVLETATIAAASTTDAGPMSADDKTKLNGIATGATANAATTTTPKMDGTAAVGTETAYAKGDHVHPTDTSRQATLVSGTNIKTIGSQSILGSGNLTPANIGAAATSHSHGNITSGGDITATAPTVASGDCLVINDDSASKITNGPAFGTSTSTYLRNDGTWATPTGEANQNAFSNVKVGSTTIAADTTTDTIEIVAGSNVTLTPDATNDKLTIAASDTDTKNTAGSTNSTSKLYLVGATTQATSAQTYSNSGVYEQNGIVNAPAYQAQDDQGNPGTFNYLKIYPYYSAASNVEAHLEMVPSLSGFSSSTLEWTGNYTLAAACAKGVDTSIASGSTSTNLPTSQAVAAYIATQMTGAATFQGTLVANGTPSSNTWDEADIEAASYKKGWYWVCQTASTPGTASTYYAGNCLEVGDMLFCVKDKGSAYAAADFTAVQNNLVEMTTAEVDAICV